MHFDCRMRSEGNDAAGLPCDYDDVEPTVRLDGELRG